MAAERLTQREKKHTYTRKHKHKPHKPPEKKSGTHHLSIALRQYKAYQRSTHTANTCSTCMCEHYAGKHARIVFRPHTQLTQIEQTRKRFAFRFAMKSARALHLKSNVCTTTAGARAMWFVVFTLQLWARAHRASCGLRDSRPYANEFLIQLRVCCWFHWFECICVSDEECVMFARMCVDV